MYFYSFGMHHVGQVADAFARIILQVMLIERIYLNPRLSHALLQVLVHFRESVYTKMLNATVCNKVYNGMTQKS